MQPRRIIVMGVSGVGKTSLAQALAAHFNAVFIEGDDLHPEANVQAMRAGQPLTDEMRAPWLDAVGQAISDIDGDVVATCSALKRAYRDTLRAQVPDLVFLCLEAGEKSIRDRLKTRSDHFMPAALLTSQLETFEPLTDDENHLIIETDCTADEVIAKAIKTLIS
ncbi:gluconokinase [Cognatishimia activa]|uniref:Gluconokinase n=1 Tax=Cognatishimia activa TaxID=1715691 RepID=A0A0P1ITT5_9RHOB|nr:gluconokinase [Cognatishimia activa]CUJ37642.1 Thermoresistant gluconokinase [Cognatishimia activa]CUK26959.1 Thermoresistant gluconokinase [Cognatishimia activa]